MSLTREEVNNVFSHCLFVEGKDDVTERIQVMGVYGTEFQLHEDRLAERERTIKRLLRDLPGIFWRPQGACFLNMNFDRLGGIWTDNPEDQDRLYLLGTAISVARRVELPKRLSQLHFDVPFIRIIL